MEVLPLLEHWNQVSVSCERPDCYACYFALRPPRPHQPSDAQRTHNSRPRFDSFDIRTERLRVSGLLGSRAMEVVLPVREKTTRERTQETSEVKQSERRQKDASRWESRPTLCKCFSSAEERRTFSVLRRWNALSVKICMHKKYCRTPPHPPGLWPKYREDSYIPVISD